MYSAEPVSDSEALPSDVRFREDLRALIEGDTNKSQHMKELLENKQRAVSVNCMQWCVECVDTHRYFSVSLLALAWLGS